MNTKKNVLAILIASTILTACGGGGGSSAPAASPSSPAAPANPTSPSNPTTPTNPTTPVTPADPAPPTQPVASNANDPYTGKAATGTATTSVSGIVVSDVTVGSIVTAYAIKADGSNGAVLGVSSATGADGKFSMQLTSVASGMVRFVAKGGSFKSEADASTQANTSTELVTPYITSDLNFFVITPATHIVSHLVSYKAKQGSNLEDAYVYGFGQFLTMTSPNVLLKADSRSGINLLKTVPGSADDQLNTYQDLLTSFEWFGVRYDLPSSVVARVFASHAEKFTLAGVDGAGAPINVGKWVNGVFDETQAVTLDEVTALRNADGTIQKNASGQILHDVPESVVSGYIQKVYRVKACSDITALPALVQRYSDDAVAFSDPNLKAGICNLIPKELDALKAKIATNYRSK